MVMEYLARIRLIQHGMPQLLAMPFECRNCGFHSLHYGNKGYQESTFYEHNITIPDILLLCFKMKLEPMHEQAEGGCSII